MSDCSCSSFLAQYYWRWRKVRTISDSNVTVFDSSTIQFRQTESRKYRTPLNYLQRVAFLNLLTWRQLLLQEWQAPSLICQGKFHRTPPSCQDVITLQQYFLRFHRVANTAPAPCTIDSLLSVWALFWAAFDVGLTELERLLPDTGRNLLLNQRRFVLQWGQSYALANPYPWATSKILSSQ